MGRLAVLCCGFRFLFALFLLTACCVVMCLFALGSHIGYIVFFSAAIICMSFIASGQSWLMSYLIFDATEKCAAFLHYIFT